MIPLPRLTVLRLMVAVATVAVLIWPAIFAARSLEYRRLAIDREEVCSVLSSEIGSFTEQAQEARSKGNLALMKSINNDIEVRKKALSEENRAALVYRKAMWRPWRKIRYR